MEIARELWFWILLLSLVLLIVGIVLFEVYGAHNTNSTTPWWIWVILGAAVFFWAIALIIYAIRARREHLAKQIPCPSKSKYYSSNLELYDDEDYDECSQNKRDASCSIVYDNSRLTSQDISCPKRKESYDKYPRSLVPTESVVVNRSIIDEPVVMPSIQQEVTTPRSNLGLSPRPLTPNNSGVTASVDTLPQVASALSTNNNTLNRSIVSSYSPTPTPLS